MRNGGFNPIVVRLVGARKKITRWRPLYGGFNPIVVRLVGASWKTLIETINVYKFQSHRGSIGRCEV